jgi:protease-4
LQKIAFLCRWFWRITAAVSILFTGCVLLFFFLVIFGAASLQHRMQMEGVRVPDGCALVLAPPGSILEKQPEMDPLTEVAGLLNDEAPPRPLLLEDIVSGLRAAAKDKRIKALLIAPQRLEQAGLDQLRDIGRAIEQFKASGKPVIAAADSYSQGQYYLASWSDEIYLHPMGSVDLHGFGLFNLYLRELLDKLEINFHVFRVGEFKAAVEPLLRKDMSPEAKENNRRWLTRLWERFCADIAKQRGISPAAVHGAVEQLAEKIEAADGDAALMALQSHLVDGLKTAAEMRVYLQSLTGRSSKEDEGFRQIDFADYIDAVKTAYSEPLTGEDRVAILPMQGDIVYGPGVDGQIGSASISKKLRKLRQDYHVKAVVLRIDSGGGSAFASELIRQELLLLRKAGKPVVVSMGSMAASGAYWISAAADRIFASPCTITGSIGIFGVVPTFEKTLAKAGIFSDGIGTTELAGADSVLMPLPESFNRAMQAQIEHGYRQFINIVADGRKMNREDVEKIAGGRIWDGAAAFELGLADRLGSLEDAVAAAAAMVGLPADQAAYIQERQSPAELFLRSLRSAKTALFASNDPLLARAGQLVRRFTAQHDFLLRKDPQHIYSHCLLPFSLLLF